MIRPPRFASLLLRLAIRDSDLRDGVLGDLEQDFGFHVELGSKTRLRRRLLYWRAVLWLSARTGVRY